MSVSSAIIIPPVLVPGDRIGMVCPAGFMEPERTMDCINILESAGFIVVVGKTMNSSSNNYFSGSDEERRADLQAMLDDPSIRAVLFGRGGYGMSRIIDQLDFSAFVQAPKWLIGFSDITILLSHVYTRFGIAGIHGPMAAAFIGQGVLSFSVKTLAESFTTTSYRYNTTPHPFNRTGECQGPLVGGNLTLLVHAIGTPSDMDYRNKILFIEDVGEYLYGIDRMLLHLERAGKLKTLAGMIVGGFTDMKDTVRPFGQTIYELIRDRLAPYNFPVCYDFPVSHGVENYALKCGVTHKLTVSNTEVVLATQ